ncbi:Uncharacterized protein FWK35_00006752, partial [Aphis craccivora]
MATSDGHNRVKTIEVLDSLNYLITRLFYKTIEKLSTIELSKNYRTIEQSKNYRTIELSKNYRTIVQSKNYRTIEKLSDYRNYRTIELLKTNRTIDIFTLDICHLSFEIRHSTI